MEIMRFTYLSTLLVCECNSLQFIFTTSMNPQPGEIRMGDDKGLRYGRNNNQRGQRQGC